MHVLCAIVCVLLHRPKALELTAVGENVVIDNLDVFKKNGFQFEIDHEGTSTHGLVYGCVVDFGVYSNAYETSQTGWSACF